MTDSKGPITNIIVALSLSEREEQLLAYGLWLSKCIAHETRLHLLSVIDYSLTPPPYLTTYLQKEHQQMQAKLAGLSAIIKNYGVDCVYTLASGRLVETFRKAIEELDADFLVLGYRSHLIRQSSSEKMIRSLNIPMLVVRGQKAEDASIDSLSVTKILLVTDFSENSLRAFDLLKRLYDKKDCQIKLTVANVISSIKVDQLFRATKEEAINSKRADYCEELLAMTHQRLDSLKARNLQIERVCRIGVPYKVIGDLALEKDIDLIFMGAKGLTSIDGMRIGSVTESVLKTSPCPVMVVN